LGPVSHGRVRQPSCLIAMQGGRCEQWPEKGYVRRDPGLKWRGTPHVAPPASPKPHDGTKECNQRPHPLRWHPGVGTGETRQERRTGCGHFGMWVGGRESGTTNQSPHHRHICEVSVGSGKEGGGSVSTQTGVRSDQNHMAVCPFDRGTGAVQRREREDGAMVTLPSHTHTPGRFDIEGHSGDRALYEDGGRRWCYRKQEIPGLALLFRQPVPVVCSG